MLSPGILSDKFKTFKDISEAELEVLSEARKIHRANQREREKLILDAARKGHTNTIRFLLSDKQIDVNTVFLGSESSDKGTLLTEAVRYQHHDLTQMLLECKLTTETLDFFSSYVDQRNSLVNAGSALQLAIKAKDPRLVKSLLEKGASPHCPTINSEGRKIDSYILYVLEEIHDFKIKQEIIRLLHSKLDKTKCTEEELIVLEYILEKNVNITTNDIKALANARKQLQKNGNDKDALGLLAFEALESNNIETLKFLLNNGLDVNDVFKNADGLPETIFMRLIGSRMCHATSLCETLLSEHKVSLETLNFSNPHTGNLLELTIRLKATNLLRNLIRRGINLVDRAGNEITGFIDEHARNSLKDEIDHLIKPHLKPKVIPATPQPQPKSRPCQSVTGWFAWCRKVKSDAVQARPREEKLYGLR